MKSKEDEFLELLRQSRDTFSEDNIDQTPEEVDEIILNSNHPMFDVLREKADKLLKKEKTDQKRIHRGVLLKRRQKRTGLQVKKHLSLLDEDLNNLHEDIDRRVKDMKVLDTEVVADIKQALDED